MWSLWTLLEVHCRRTVSGASCLCVSRRRCGLVDAPDLVPALMALCQKGPEDVAQWAGTSFSKQDVGCLPHLADR